MLFIHGVGASFPDNVITNDFLADLNSEFDQQDLFNQLGIKQRRTSLPLDYIEKTKNSEPSKALEVASTTPTDLAVAATELALQRANLEPQDIGLALASCITPSETCPSEAQRVCNKFGLKIPAYDITRPASAFPFHLEILDSTNPDKLPDYILLIATGTATQVVNYNQAIAAASCGDAASAAIVSAKHQAKLNTKYIYNGEDLALCSSLQIDCFGHLHGDLDSFINYAFERSENSIVHITKESDLSFDNTCLIGPEVSKSLTAKLKNKCSIQDDAIWSSIESYGNTWGASALVVLSENWDKLDQVKNIFVSQVGFGLSWGSILIESDF